MTGKSRKSGASSATPVPPDTTGALRLRISELASRGATSFVIEPDAAARSALAGELGLLALPRLRFEGRLEPQGRRDWRLTARLGASVVQPCVVTLEPVKSRIDEEVERLFAADWIEPEGEEVEMPEDDRIEPLPDAIEVGAIMAESLALALPLYPRAAAEGAGDGSAAPPGAEPLTDESARPFAGLEALRARLERGGNSGD